jgi:hypothetical protein
MEASAEIDCRDGSCAGQQQERRAASGGGAAKKQGSGGGYTKNESDERGEDEAELSRQSEGSLKPEVARVSPHRVPRHQLPGAFHGLVHGLGRVVVPRMELAYFFHPSLQPGACPTYFRVAATKSSKHGHGPWKTSDKRQALLRALLCAILAEFTLDISAVQRPSIGLSSCHRRPARIRIPVQARWIRVSGHNKDRLLPLTFVAILLLEFLT